MLTNKGVLTKCKEAPSATPLKAAQTVEKPRVTNRITNTPTALESAKEQTSASSTAKRKKRCSKCGYEYPYNAERNYPLNCPNCGASSSTQFMSNMCR